MNNFPYCQGLCNKESEDGCFVLHSGSIKCIVSFIINHINDLSFLISFCKANKDDIVAALQEKKFEGHLRRAEMELLEINKFISQITKILDKKPDVDVKRKNERIIAPPFMIIHNVTVGGIKLSGTFKVINMSFGGCFVDINAFEHQVKIGDEIIFDMCLNDNCILGVKGIVRHASSFMKKQGIGIEIITISDFEEWKKHVTNNITN